MGFLTNGEKTGYQVKKEMEVSTNFFFNTSQGSINPAFKKLEKEGMVTSLEKVENGRLKKIYSITEKGEKCFQEWMNQEIQIAKVKEELLLKIFFFSKISPDERDDIIERYLSKLAKNIEK